MSETTKSILYYVCGGTIKERANANAISNTMSCIALMQSSCKRNAISAQKTTAQILTFSAALHICPPKGGLMD